MMEKMQKNQSDSDKSRLQYDCLLQSTFQMPFNVLTKPQTVYKNIKKSTKAYEHGFCHTILSYKKLFKKFVLFQDKSCSTSNETNKAY